MIFLMAGPLTNPVVLVSTWYAFGGDLSMVGGRLLLGWLNAVLVGATFAFYKKNPLKAFSGPQGTEELIPSEKDSKASLFLLHSRYEFWYTFRYVIMGAWLAAIFQVSIRPILEGAGLTSGVSSVLCMMLIAFCLLALCDIGCHDRKEPFALHGTVIRHGLPSLRSCHGSQECPSHVFHVQEILRHPLGTGNDPYDICLLDALRIPERRGMMGLFSNKRGMAGVFISFLLIALLALFAAKGYQNYVMPYVRYALFASLFALAAWLFLAIREWRRRSYKMKLLRALCTADAHPSPCCVALPSASCRQGKGA